MSRIGKQPINIPSGVQVSLKGDLVDVVGPKGNLSFKLPKGIKIEISENVVTIVRDSDSKIVRALHGTCRAVIANLVKGVSEGFSKQLELVGTGYRAEIQGENLVLTVGFIHPVVINAPPGISFSVSKMIITVSGYDKVLVGQIASKIRDVRPPEPYKGKGIKYVGEVIRRKAGKAAKTAGK